MRRSPHGWNVARRSSQPPARPGPAPGRSKTIVIVDAYSTGAALAPLFAEQGIACVHVQSSAKLPVFYTRSFRPEDFDECIVHRGSLVDTLKQLRPHRPAFVLAGAESGVVLADTLGDRLGTPGNGTALSPARRDKFLMSEAVRHAGLAAVRQIKTSSRERALAWATARGEWPVVLKPLDSAGTDGVTFCADAGALGAAFDALIGRANRLGQPNSELLLQGHLSGQEMFVNSISWEGVHRISEIWRVTKRRMPGASVVYDYEELLPATGPQQDQVVPYTEAVLDALDIHYGPAHTEMMLTDEGPVLIECGARLQGTLLPQAIDRAAGASHPKVTVEAYTDPYTVSKLAGARYHVEEHSYCVDLISDRAGKIVSDAPFRRLERLASYFGRVGVPGPGEALRRTVDLFSSPGVVYLLSPSEDQLADDYLSLRRLERDGLFEIAASDRLTTTTTN